MVSGLPPLLRSASATGVDAVFSLLRTGVATPHASPLAASAAAVVVLWGDTVYQLGTASLEWARFGPMECAAPVWADAEAYVGGASVPVLRTASRELAALALLVPDAPAPECADGGDVVLVNVASLAVGKVVQAAASASIVGKEFMNFK